jgi:hypothetical protein
MAVMSVLCSVVRYIALLHTHNESSPKLPLFHAVAPILFNSYVFPSQLRIIINSVINIMAYYYQVGDFTDPAMSAEEEKAR